MKKLTKLLLSTFLAASAQLASAQYNPSDLLLVFHQAGKRDVEYDLGNVSAYLGQPAGTVIPVSYDKAFAAAATNFNNNFTSAKYALVAGDNSQTLWLSDFSMSVTPSGFNPNGAAFNLVQGRLNNVGVLGDSISYNSPGEYTNSPNLGNSPISLATAASPAYTWLMTGGSGNQVTTLGGQMAAAVSGNYGTAVSFYQYTTNAPTAATLVGTFTMDASGNLSFVAGQIIPVIRSGVVSGTVAAGGTTTLSASVDGATGYQWYRNGVAVSGGTNSSLTVDGAPGNGGSYYVVATNATYGTSVTSATGTVTVPTYNASDLLLVFHQTGKRDVEYDLGSVSAYLGQPAGTVIPVSYNKAFAAAATNFNNNFTSAKYALVAGDNSQTLWLSDFSMGVTPSGFNPNGAAFNLVQGRLNNVGALGANVGLANGPISLATAASPAYTWLMTGGSGNQVTTLGGQMAAAVSGNYGTAVSFYQYTTNAPTAATLVGTFTMDASGNLSFVAGQIIPVIRSGVVSGTVAAGGTTTLSASVDGATGYQWYRNGVAVSGGTNSSLTVDGAPGNGGSYYVVATNATYGTSVTSATGTVTVPTYNASDLLLVFHQTGKRDVEYDLGSVSAYLGQPAGTVIPVSYNKAFAAAATNFNNNFTSAKYALVAGDNSQTLWLSDFSMGVTPSGFNPNGAAFNLVQGRLNNVGALGANVGLANGPISLATAASPAYTWLMTGGSGNQVTTLGGQMAAAVSGNYGTAVSFYQYTTNAPTAATLVGTFTMDASGNLSFVAGQIIPVIRSGVVSGTVAAGGTTTLSASVDGATGYQWYRNGVAVSGGTNSSLTVDGAPGNGGSYYVVATNATYGTSVTSATGTVTVPTYNASDLLLVFHQTGKRDVEYDLGSVSAYLGQPAGTVIPVSYNKAFAAATTNFNNNFTSAKYALVAGDNSQTLWLSDFSMGVTPSGFNPNGAAFNLVQGRLNNVGALGANVGLANGPISLATAASPAYTWLMTGGSGNQVTTLGGQMAAAVSGNYGTAVSFYQYTTNAPTAATLVGTFTMDASGNLSFVAGQIIPVIRSATSGNVTLNSGDSISINADGATGLQWYGNGAAISGATNSSFVPKVNGFYTAVASNSIYGTSVTSAGVTVSGLTAEVQLVAGYSGGFTNTYVQFSTNLPANTWVYLELDPANGSPIRPTQRSLGYREVDYKKLFANTLGCTPVTPTTNFVTGVITYDYSGQNNKGTKLVGFWASKDLPIVAGPDGNAYITDGHHTTAGYMASTNSATVLPGFNRLVLGHVASNVASGPAIDDSWWASRLAENNAYLYGTNGNILAVSGDAGYAGLQPIFPSTNAMATTPSTVGAGAMTYDYYRALTWGMVDGIIKSGANNGAVAALKGYSKANPYLAGSPDINFVEFFWADFLRNRIVWDNTQPETSGATNPIHAPLSFYAAVANGIALAKSELYRDQFGRSMTDYTNGALYSQLTTNWAEASLSNGLAVASQSYHLYLRDDSTIQGDIIPSALSTNIMNIDTVAGLTVTGAVQNIKSLLVNAGWTVGTAWKDAIVGTTYGTPNLTNAPGSGVVSLNGNTTVSGTTTLSNGTLRVNGTLTSAQITVAGGTIGGNGVVNGPLNIAAGATLSPGASIGILTVSNSLTLAGSTFMEINKTGAVLTNDSVLVSGMLTFGGTLTVTNTGSALTNGNSFKLFNAASYAGTFTSLNLPTLSPGLAWDTLQLYTNGTIAVAGNAPIKITTQPLALLRKQGQVAIFSVKATGTAPYTNLTYQWKFNGTNIGAATAASYTNFAVDIGNAGNYSVEMANGVGSTNSANALLTVNLDTNKPTVAITAPAANATIFTATSNLVGTATDNARVAQVLVSLNGGAFTAATLGINNTLPTTASWSYAMTLAVGTNTVAVKTVDFAGNETTPVVTRSFFFAVPSPLTVNIVGGGYVNSSNQVASLGGTNLFVNRRYTLTALPSGTNWLFSNWVNTATSEILNANPVTNSKNSYTFLMSSNLTLTANFVHNRFVEAAGSYYALFSETNGAAEKSAGYFTVKTTYKQTFSGSLFVDGQKVGIAGSFDLAGVGTPKKPVTRQGKATLTVALQLNFDDTIGGTVSCADEGWTAPILGDRAVFNPLTNPATNVFAPKYTLLIPGSLTASNAPAGYGYSTFTIGLDGTVKSAGALADGDKYVPFKSSVSKNGDVAIYSPQYRGSFNTGSNSIVSYNGCLIGWLTINTNTSLVSGNLEWIKTGWTNGYYDAGFTNTSAAQGCVYVAPAAGTRGIFITNGLASFSDGNLAALQNLNVTITNNNKFTFATNGVTVKGATASFSAASGLVTGTFTNVTTGVKTKYTGVYLPQQNIIGAAFKGTTQTGGILITNK